MAEPECTSIGTLLSVDVYEAFYSNSNLDLDLMETDAKKLINHFRPGLDRESAPTYSLYKLLHAMLDHAPCTEGKRYVISVLHAIPRTESALLVVAKAWLSNLIFQMLALNHLRSPVSGEQTPTIDEAAIYIERADRTEQNSLRDQVAEREHHHCAVTDFVDATLNIPGGTDRRAHMVAAHIMPLSLNSSDKAKSIRDLTTTWDLLRNWTSIDFRALSGSDINTPKNAIFMTSDCHKDFGNFQFYFDGFAFPEPNKYMVRSVNANPLIGLRVREAVCEFDAHPSIASPDSHLLAIHAAFAKVLYACAGAGGHFDSVLRDMEEVKVLSSDGGTDIGPLLSSRLAISVF
ncbi:hypothetical protein EDD18DRAFT_1163175 [Armillaria luteobubalina]|uniref:HNH nuclease domain-containing protein n=1 Tax=Armillaria luteobubalina TaxID=153913 RepID=A0AA39Q5H9_9AGAR|nr:hypothetical protein EDD18DRAFT_1163175 [Armillaria luteobubalina]